MPRSRSRRPKPLLIFIVPAIILTSILFLFFAYNYSPTNITDSTRIPFSISKGESLDSIANNLIDQNLIHSIPAFKIHVLLSNNATKIQAGDFSLSRNKTLPQIIETLTHGTSDRWVTLLEGWRREQIAQAIVDSLATDDNKDYAFDPDIFITNTATLEGKLYPDTYSLAKGTTTQQTIDRLTQRFESQTASLQNKSTLSDYDALILASLIEREALTNKEKPIIAGILYNRLNNDWPLQVDATIQYVKASQICRILTCDWWPQEITKDDLEINSSYNTYQNQGLPPAPISNPSIESINAAYNSTITDYWFYLHDASGQVHYARTIEEHNQNISKYLN
jgi:UPF0755 protein